MRDITSTRSGSAFHAEHPAAALPLLAELSTPEQFLISALRLWGNGRMQETQCCCRSLLRNGFHAAGLLATEFEHFDRMIGLIDSGLRDRGWIADAHCGALTPSEARYLRALALCQHARGADARAVLHDWLPPSVARLSSCALASFARSCALVGLVVPDRAWAIAPRRNVVALRRLH